MTRYTRRSVLRLAAIGGAGSLLRAGHAGPPPAPAPEGPVDFVTPATQTAIDSGLAFLARSQREDGGFATERPPGPTAVGVAALAGLALLAGGHHPGRGRYARTVSRTADYLLAAADGPVSGFLTPPGGPRAVTEEWNQRAMYSHGFGCLFLGELSGTLPDPERQRRVRAALERAVGYTVRAQCPDGGWRYTPHPPYSDASATVAHLLALRAARNAGVLVRKEVIDAAGRFLRACQRPDGGFSYTPGAGETSMFARSAAALVGLFSTGAYSGPEVERGLRYVQQFRPGRSLTSRELPPAYYYYAHYYAALAMWTAGGTYWAAWAPAARDELLARARDGAWDDRIFGPVYATAMSLIVLQLSDHYLPILQA
ncbi:Prenyltransferase and squalene oxidase repeat protein [Gemmata obscuriglobus]|uniref:Prenyltransferase n=1 Tax=Gemmata obscuriglobus TaxID=114 RepID=A0A2Z3H267_9BACT|nr:prenyltransferase/squalene oxidase repeat-containing protein [Gemmata obscuriglobus]AWM40869.1 prenyltransferase [Gemmata obscuriglobus]QEG25839.1 Prenyltransferase and squalene oxidase repeat protein [Gemmata obscuriglobus]VTR99795.1 Uncultured bacterium genome assembly Metasoil_fosmids_resub OS=uncultured bacterium PE=4 SV=1: Prenyltrans_1 [Gemmata obscuriglobus UQM 2246]